MLHNLQETLHQEAGLQHCGPDPLSQGLSGPDAALKSNARCQMKASLALYMLPGQTISLHDMLRPSLYLHNDL